MATILRHTVVAQQNHRKALLILFMKAWTRKWWWVTVITMMSFLLGWIFFPDTKNFPYEIIYPQSITATTSSTTSTSKYNNHRLHFACPTKTVRDQPQNYHEFFEDHYENAAKALPTNMTEFLIKLGTIQFDGWKGTYEHIKATMYPWKVQQFVPHLQDGDSIYESAAGIGLNLYLTLEILYQVKGVTNIRVYGNDYYATSVDKANQIFDEIPPAKAKRGVLCPADSVNLFFVPSNAFDLTFTGFIWYV